MLPKAERADALHAAARARHDLRVIALIESARGIAHAREIAGTPGVVRLAFGSLDLRATSAARRRRRRPRSHCAEVVLASRLAGLPAPIDGVTPSIDDDTRLRADVQRRAASVSAPSCASIRASCPWCAKASRRPKPICNGRAVSCRPRVRPKVRRSPSMARWSIHRCCCAPAPSLTKRRLHRLTPRRLDRPPRPLGADHRR